MARAVALSSTSGPRSREVAQPSRPSSRYGPRKGRPPSTRTPPRTLGRRRGTLASMHPVDLIGGARRRLLRSLYRRRFGAFGAGSSYDPTTSSIDGYQNFYLGRNVYIGGHAILSAVGVSVVIGDDTIIGPGLCIMAGDHEFSLPAVSFHEISEGRNAGISIGRNVWIGARVIVLKSVTIGDAAVIGAGSVVTRDVQAFALVAGTPARFLRWRFEGAERDRHQAFIDRELAMPKVPSAQ